MHAGFEVSEAATGTEALTKAIALNPNLIVLDIQLPDRNGGDHVCKELKRNPETAHICDLYISPIFTGMAPNQFFGRRRQGRTNIFPFRLCPAHSLNESGNGFNFNT